MDDKELFLKFAKQLSNWSRTGKEPELADWDTRAYLDLQEKRLTSKGLKRHFDFAATTKVYKVGDFALGLLLNGYNKRVNYAVGHKKVEYFKGKKSVGKMKKEVPFYQMIRQPDTKNDDWKQDTYVCPNCGNIEKIAKFETEGCQYCGTNFIVSELYPKVTNFYSIDSGAERKISFGRIIAIGIVSFILAILAGGVYFKTQELQFSIYILFGFLWAIFWAIGLFFSPVIYEIQESSRVTRGSAGAKRKISSKLKKYDETFSYDYFEGKALSLLRMIVFAENPNECIQYRGNDLNPKFQDIVDMDYCGAFGVEKIQEVDDYVEVTLKVFMKNTYFTGKKCKKKNDDMFIRMRHNIKWRVQPEFSIVKVACHSCGGSFDATKHRNCPFCQNEYDTGIDDWIVMDIHL